MILSTEAPTVQRLHVPSALAALPQWIDWRNEDGDKKPYDVRTGRKAKCNDDTTWAPLAEAQAVVDQYSGLGFEFKAGGGIFGVDLDGCIAGDGSVADWAMEVLQRIPTYAEISPSGSGIKLFGLGEKPEGYRSKLTFPGDHCGVECYDRGRYFTFTGQRFPGAPHELTECQEGLNWLCEKYLKAPVASLPALATAAPASADRAKTIARARAYLAKMPPAISGQGGHDATFDAAIVLKRGFGLEDADAWPLLSEFNQRCQPAWSDGELRHKLDGAAKARVPHGYLLEERRNGSANGQHYEFRKQSPQKSEPPPSAATSEKYIGGALLSLADPTDLLDSIRPEDIHSGAIRALIRVAAELAEQHLPIELPTVETMLDARGQLEPGLLRECIETAISGMSWPPHVEAIREAARQRRAHQLGVRLQEAAREGGELIGEAVAAARDFEQADVGDVEIFQPAHVLAANATEQRYLIDGVVTEAQSGVIGGSHKSCKTTVGCEIAVAGASGTPFLGKFDVPAPFNVGVLSAESGAATITRRMEAFAQLRGLTLADLPGLHLATQSIDLMSEKALTMLRRLIERLGWLLLILDPAYLLLARVGESASNVFAMGSALARITQLIDDTGCSVFIAHHFKRSRTADRDQFSPPELIDLSMSGLAEWARCWLLLGRRKPWNEDLRQHWLWLRLGGSAGHASLNALDVTEETHMLDWHQAWSFTCRPAAESQEQDRTEKERKTEAKAAAQLQADMKRIVDLLVKLPERCETGKQIRERLAMSGNRFAPAIAALLESGDVVPSQIRRANRTFDAYALPGDPSTGKEASGG